MPQIIFGEFADRNNSIYPQDRVVAQHTSGRFAGKVTSEWEETRAGSNYPVSVRVIDNAVRVESVDARTRKEVLDSFANLEDEMRQLKSQETSERNKGLVATGLGAVATIVPIACVSVLAAPVAAAAAVSGVALTIFGGTYAYKHQQVANQADGDATQARNYQEQWKDPLPQIQTQRRQAGEGFVTPHRNSWKGSIVHPDELADLWIGDLSTQRRQSHHQIDLPGQTDFVKSAFEAGLLSRAALNDIREVAATRGEIRLVNGDTLSLDAIDNMVAQYEVHHKAYVRLNTRVDTAVSQIHASLHSAMTRLSRQQEQWLIPAQMTRDSALNQARQMREMSLAPLRDARNQAIAQIERDYRYVPTDPFDPEQRLHKAHVEDLRQQELTNVRRQYNSDPLVRQIERDWQQQQQWVEFMYVQAAAPVIQWFDQQREQVQHEGQEQISFVERRREEEIVRFFQPLKQILGNRDPSLSTQLPLGNFSWNNWQPRAHEPAFHQFYSRPPVYHRDFGDRVSEAVWNLFMGQEGVYGFSGRQQDQWNTCQPTFGSGWPCEARRVPVGARMADRFHAETPMPPPPGTRKAEATAGMRRR